MWPLIVLAHEPHSWFLFRDDDTLLLDVNFSHGAVGYSVLIELTAEEKAEYSLVRYAYLNGLAQAVQDAGPGSALQLRDVTATFGRRAIDAVEEWRKSRQGPNNGT